MANLITGGRILCSIFLLFSQLFSPAFCALYLTAGLTDILDGAVARKTQTVSEFGSQLDTVADGVLPLCVSSGCCPFWRFPHGSGCGQPSSL